LEDYQLTPKQLKAARKRLGLSQHKLAGRLGVSDGRTVRRWEREGATVPGPVAIAVEALVKAARDD